MVVDGPHQAVFATTELLENILSLLPPKALFGCLRVSKKFRDVITASIILQRKMGLRASGRERQTWAITPGRISGKFFAEYYAAFSRLDSEAANSPPSKAVTPVELSFLLQLHVAETLKENSARRSYAYGHKEEVIMLPPNGSLTGEHSWHQILLTDPPTTKAKVWLRWDICEMSRCASTNGRIAREVHEPAGITFGALIGALMGCRKKYAGTWYDGHESGNHEETTLGELLGRLEKKHGRKAGPQR